MTTQAAIERWDTIRYEVENARESWLYPEAMTAAYRDFVWGVSTLVETVMSPFSHAWQTDRSAEGSDLYPGLVEVVRPRCATGAPARPRLW